MCRFVLYHGPPITMAALLTEPSHSLIRQSVHSRERAEPLNGDGFGVAWYEPRIAAEPALFRSVTPAWNNMNLLHLARLTRSPAILAHVRAASPGLPVTETNCHPFTSGNLAFMHNGEVGGFRRLRRRLIDNLSDEAYGAIGGTTDSEHLFALVLDRLAANGHAKGAEALAGAMVEAVEMLLGLAREAECDAPHYLNLALADGQHAVACRFTSADPATASSLYLHTGKRYVCEGGLCRMVEPEEGHGTVIVSSEPLSGDPGWTRVPPNHLVVIERQEAAVRPMALLPA